MGTAAIVGVGVVGALLLGLSQRQKMVMEYGKLSDRRWQGSEFGTDIPRTHGTTGLEGCQIIYMEHNELKEKVKHKSSGGKGGGSQPAQDIYTYFATFILLLKRGQSAGIRRMWCGDKLIYNAGSDDLETIIASNQKAKGWRFYRGTDDQMPDPRYEAEYGVGNVPAFRGYSYIAFYDFPLKDHGNSLQAAQFKVELVSEVNDSVALIGSASKPYTDPHSNPGYSPRCQYVTPEKAVFYSPQWSNFDQPNSTVIVHECYTSGFRRQYSMIVGSTTAADVPPNGDSDQDDLFWKSGSQVFGGTEQFYGPSGYIQRRGGLSVGISVSGGKKLFSRSTSDMVTHNLATTANCFAIDGATIYAFASDGVRVYDANLTLLSTHLFALPSLNFPLARAEVVDGEIYLYDGQITAKVFRIGPSLTGYQQIAVIPPMTEDGYYSSSVSLSGDMLVRAHSSYISSKKLFVEWFNLKEQGIAPTLLADVIEKEVTLSNLITADDIDTSLLTQEIRGFRVSGGTIRSVIETLQGAYPFDVRQHGFKLQFVPRGQPPVMTIPWEDLAAANGDDIGDSLPYSREMDSQLPRKVTIKAVSSTREYGASIQSYERQSTSAVNEEEREIPLVLTDNEVAQMAEKLLNLRWLERNDYQGPSLPPKYLALEPADVVAVKAKFGTFELRLTDVGYEADGRLTCKSKANSAPLYSSNAVGGQSPGSGGTIPLAGESLFLPLDIPTVNETVQNAPGFVSLMTGYTDGYPGGVAVRSVDSGQTWTELQGFTGIPTVGAARGTLPASACTLIDQRSLVVDLITGSLESITRDQMLVGHNYAAYGVNGRWEIVRFQNATLQADGSYLLSGLVRGDRGTEWASGLHQAGDWFVLLDDPDNVFISMAVGSIGIPAVYRGVTSGASIDSASDVPFTYQGVNLECLSPVYPRGSRDVSSNFSGTFTRRSRLSSSWWSNGVQAPVGETSEAYEIDVMSGTAVKRTIPAASPAWAYSVADQTTDFGAPQSSITFRIYQLSATVGRGYPLEVTL